MRNNLILAALGLISLFNTSQAAEIDINGQDYKKAHPLLVTIF